MRKLLFIYNPIAGRKKYYPIEKIIKQYFVGKENEYEITWQNLSQEKPFGAYAPQDFDLIFAIGGDGTVKEIATWIIQQKSSTPLAIIPAGSANLLAGTLGIPLYVRKALIYNLEHHAQPIDVGMVNNRHFFLVAAGCGFDAKVIKNTSRKLKRIFGFLAYAVGLLKSFFNIRAAKIFIKFNDKTLTLKPQSVVVTNLGQLLNIRLNPESKSNDGYLNVSIFNPITLWDINDIVLRILQGKYTKDWRYHYYKTKEIYILPLKGRMPMQIDGEVTDLPYLDIKVLPLALNIICDKLP